MNMCIMSFLSNTYANLFKVLFKNDCVDIDGNLKEHFLKISSKLIQ